METSLVNLQEDKAVLLIHLKIKISNTLYFREKLLKKKTYKTMKIIAKLIVGRMS